MASMTWVKHGDVTIQPSTIPVDAIRSTRRVLAEGEATGHAHRLVEEADVEAYERDGVLYLRVGPGGAGVTHEEHGLGVIPEGDYRVGRVQEYDHFLEESRAVRD